MKLVTLDTLHWYYEGPEPTKAANRYDRLACQRKSVKYFIILFVVTTPNSSLVRLIQKWRMGRAYIKQQATARKKKGMGTSNPSKRKPFDKNKRPPKKSKVVKEPVMAILAEGKLPSPPVHGRGRGLMTSQVPSDEKRPILLREDPQYALK